MQTKGAWMKFLVSLAVVIAAVAGIYQWGGNSLSERQVRAFYERADEAMAIADDKALCELLAEDYQQSVVMKTENAQSERSLGKKEYCAELARTMDMMRQLQAQLGRIPLRHQQTIKSITLSEDGSTAKVELSSVLEIPGMRMVSRGRDTIERNRWKVLVTRSVAVVHAGANH